MVAKNQIKNAVETVVVDSGPIVFRDHVFWLGPQHERGGIRLQDTSQSRFDAILKKREFDVMLCGGLAVVLRQVARHHARVRDDRAHAFGSEDDGLACKNQQS